MGSGLDLLALAGAVMDTTDPSSMHGTVLFGGWHDLLWLALIVGVLLIGAWGKGKGRL